MTRLFDQVVKFVRVVFEIIETLLISRNEDIFQLVIQSHEAGHMYAFP
jgi:hypothetical protein